MSNDGAARKLSRRGSTGVGGIVLAGGRASRFGSEKAIALFGGAPLLTRVASTLAQCCEAVAVSARPHSRTTDLANALRLEVLRDDPQHPDGPLAGLAAGLTWARGRGLHCLVTLPCDTPLVTKTEARALLAGLRDRPAAYAVTDRGPHPLCAVWRTDLCDSLRARLAAGEHPAIRSFLGEIDAAEVRFRHSRLFGNINTPEDLAALEGEAT